MFLVKNLFSKKGFNLCFLILCLLSLGQINAYSQCDVNSPYDKIVSGYHASIAIKSNGVYSVWGTSMKADGVNDQLTPQDIDATNYPGLTGTIIKAAIGGSTSGSAVDQAILLTSTGLWAWGIEGNVLNNSLTSSAAFARISAPSGAQPTGLPNGVSPTDVKAMFATYQTLFLLTNSGNVWVLTQTSLALEGNGGTVTSAGSNSWKQIKTDATTYLSNIKNVRAQVSSGIYNAFIAETNSGQLYTWGNTTFLGNGTNVSAKNYATLMTLPSGVASSGIKMIGVTGGDGGTSVANTYYLVSNDGKLFTLGDNKERQCGDFTTTDRTTWVQVQKSATSGDYLTNINYISVQEHNSSYPAASAITSTGDLYTWGNNSKNMLGRTTDGTMYDPGFPGGFLSGTDKALFAEMGGHTLVYAKVGTSQFCYVGHRIQGSMGDGTSDNQTETIFNCNTTPSLSLCGSVPISANLTKSTIVANPTSIIANGTSTSTITIQLKNSSNVNLTTTGGTVVVSTTDGSLGTVSDNNNGTYTVILTSSNTVTTTTIGFSVNGTTATGTNSTTTVNFTPISGSPSISITGTTSVFSTCLNTVSASQSFTVTASDLTADLTITAPSGYQIASTQVGTYTNSLTFSATSGTISATDIWVRLTGVTAGTFTGTIDASSAGATTKSVSVSGTVNASSVGGTISGSTSVCSGTNSTTLTLSGYTGNITKWQSSTSENFNTVIDIANTTNSLTATNLNETRYYRAIIQSGTCASVNSNNFYIEVKSCVQENKIVANPDNNTTYVNIPVNGNVSTNDINSTEVKYGLPQALNTNPIGAIISMNTSSGIYTFTATKSGKYEFYVSICGEDNTSNCQFSLLQISVLDPTISNNLPVAKVDIATTNLNTAVTTSVLTNDKSGNIGTVLVPSSVSIVTKPINGAAVVNSDGSITYTPTNGFSGNDSLVYNVCDDAIPANCQSTLVYYKILTAGAISTTSAIDDYAFVNNNKTGNASVSGNVLKNDKNTSEANLIATLITGPTEIQGNLILSADGSFKFTPALGFSGPADIVYNACSIDDPTICSKATLHIVVYPPPTINPDFNSTNVNIPVTGNINTNDIIPAGTTYGTPFALEKNPKGATIVLNTNTGTYSFTASKSGKYNFNISVCAASQLSGCPISSLKITVLDPTKTNNPPVANDDYSVTQINKPVITSILSNDKPGNKNTLLIASSIVIDSSPKNGTASANKATSSSSSNSTNRAFSTNGTITYTPNPGFVGLDSLVYTVCDNANPANCEVATVYYTISTATPNNVLVANDDYNTSLNLITSTGNVLLNDDYGGAVITASVVNGPTAAQGTFILSSDGAYSFTPAFGFTGPVDIIYQACSGSTCVNATLHILVDLVPPPPPTVINATYVAGSKSNPTNIKSLVTVTPIGTTLKWCDPAGTNCATTPPTIPNIPGTYIWCVKSVDTVTLLSSTCAMDTVIILAPYTVMEVAKSARAVQANPDGSVLLTFVLKATNKTNALMDSVSIKDDLTQTFNTISGFSIASLDVYGGLIKNSGYDGVSNSDLVTNQSKIAANSSDSLVLKVLVASPNIFGSLTNTAILGGKTKYGYVSVNSNDPIANPTDSTKRTPTAFFVPKADLIIAGGFSPNYDGLNDKWIIVRPFGTRVEVQVFNRWGNIVYQNADYKNDWNGIGSSNFMGQDVPDGTYFYIVNAIDPSGAIKKFTSSLTIVR